MEVQFQWDAAESPAEAEETAMAFHRGWQTREQFYFFKQEILRCITLTTMEQIKALNALEPFLALTKSATSRRAAEDLITRATSAPNTFVFSELLLAPQIQDLERTTDSTYPKLLEIFCYGSYQDYAHQSDLPPLTEAQTLKLRQLSLLTLAKNPENLTYTKLISSLQLTSPSDLEHLVITAIYAGLITGTLDPHNQRVCISSAAPLRDVAPSSIPILVKTLCQWSDRCTSALTDLEAQIAEIKRDATRRKEDELLWEGRLEKLMEKDETTTKNRKTEGAVKRGFFGGPANPEDRRADVDSDDDGTDDRKGTSGVKKTRKLAGLFNR